MVFVINLISNMLTSSRLDFCVKIPLIAKQCKDANFKPSFAQREPFMDLKDCLEGLVIAGDKNGVILKGVIVTNKLNAPIPFVPISMLRILLLLLEKNLQKKIAYHFRNKKVANCF